MAGIFDNFMSRLGWVRQPADSSSKGRPPRQARPSRRRSAHVDPDPFSPMTSSLWAVMPPTDANLEWAVQDLDAQALTAMPAAELLDLLARISPEVSKAFWDFVVYVGNAVDIVAYKPGTKEKDTAAERALDDFLKKLEDQHNSILEVIHRIIAGGFLRGAFASELILDAGGRVPLDLATPDPNVFRFRKVNDSERGWIWELGQVQRGGRFVSFADLPTVRYVPILPQVGSAPYGISWVEPAIFPAVFLIALLHDLRRVVANQGYARQDIVVKLESLRASMPPTIANDPNAWREWVEATIDEIAAAYSQLKPDDAWVHTDATELAPPVGVLGSTQMTAAVDQLMQSVERMTVRALKTIPFLLAARQTTTETQATREWEAFSAGIRIIQNKLGQMLDRLLTLSLEAQGIQADVVIKFGFLNETDRLSLAQTEAAEIENEARKVAEGWQTNDEAAENITGSPAVGQPSSRVVAVDMASGESLSRFVRRVPGRANDDGRFLYWSELVEPAVNGENAR